MRVIRVLVLSVISLCVVAPAAEEADDIMAFVADHQAISSLESITAVANVTTPDGRQYPVETTYWHPLKAFFTRNETDNFSTLGIWGKYNWHFNGERQQEVGEGSAEFVLLHQFHAALIHFTRLFDEITEPVVVQLDGCACLQMDAKRVANDHTFYFEQQTGRPYMWAIHRDDQPDVRIFYSDWRTVDGMMLPFVLNIQDAADPWLYEFTEVRVNNTPADAHYPPFSTLTDEQQLLKLHQDFVDVHLLGRTVTEQPAAQASTYTVAYQGEIFTSEGSDFSEFYQRIFSTRDYFSYNDLIRPVVKVSDDGTLGWIIVQIQADGVRFDEQRQPAGPLEFTSAWVSLYEKNDGEWRMAGNVSNFKPDMQ